jgi:hypothetical protein
MKVCRRGADRVGFVSDVSINDELPPPGGSPGRGATDETLLI